VALPLLPTPLGELGRRHFAFYPAIKGVEHNEWILGRVSWTEVQVINGSSAEELWIPRRLLGEVSRADGPVAIVGLLKELEYKQGVVLPQARRVIEMPRAVNDSPRAAPAHQQPASVVAIRPEPVGDSRARKLLRGSVAVGILACVAAGFLVRDLHVGTHAGPWIGRRRLRGGDSQTRTARQRPLVIHFRRRALPATVVSAARRCGGVDGSDGRCSALRRRGRV
jgi:hypothetical protein